MPTFQVFKERLSRGRAGPTVTLQRGGVFALNTEAYECLDKAEAVELVIDPDERVMGFHPVEPNAPHAYRVRPQVGSKTFLVSGRSFIARYGLTVVERAEKYPAEMMGDVLAVDLKKGPILVAKSHAKKGASPPARNELPLMPAKPAPSSTTR